MNANIAIIGAGPAGVAAAVQLRRFGLEVDIYERNSIGGLARNANLIENYPPYYLGISGDNFARLLTKHLLKYIEKPIFENVINLEYQNENFNIITDNASREYKVIIIASGTVPKIPSIVLPDSNRILYEVSDLGVVNNKTISIVGSGDAAFDYALNLSKSTNNKIKILNRTDTVKCLPLLFDRALSNVQIEYLENEQIRIIESAKDGLHIFTNTADYDCDYLLFAIGRDENIAFLSDSVTDHQLELKSRNRLFFIGDVSNGLFRQISISTGDGVRCAMEIYNSLKNI